MFEPVELDGGVVVRLLAPGDGPALAAAYSRNREHLAPWEPLRTPEFFTAAWHERDVAGAMLRIEAGTLIPLVLERGRGEPGERGAGERGPGELDRDEPDAVELVGRLNLSDLVRGVFQNAHLGYWIDGRLNGQGLATTAVGVALHHARTAGLHRVQAGTLVHNVASQRVLERNGFERIGLARRYLRIAGEWQDHVLFERLLED